MSTEGLDLLYFALVPLGKLRKKTTIYHYRFNTIPIFKSLLFIVTPVKQDGTINHPKNSTDLSNPLFIAITPDFSFLLKLTFLDPLHVGDEGEKTRRLCSGL